MTVARPSLLRRLRRLEKRLKVPEDECAVCEGELREAEIVTLTAIRIHNPQSNLAGKSKNKENISLFFAKNALGSKHSGQPEVSREVLVHFPSLGMPVTTFPNSRQP